MVATDRIDGDDVQDDHLYVCQYADQQTISVGRDIELWNEGLPQALSIQRDLGRIVHSWIVTEAGIHDLRMDHVTNYNTFVMIPTAQTQQKHPIIVEDADPTLEFPTQMFTVSQVNTAVKGADPDEVAASAAERTAIADNSRVIAEQINDGVEAAFRELYEGWRADQGTYPEGTDFGYDVSLPTGWKRRVIADRTNLTAAQIDLLATAGFPMSMRVAVNVDTPDAVDERVV